MLYGFSVTPSINNSEPLYCYFEGLRVLAAKAVQSSHLSYEQVWNICEYLDAVDSRALHSSKVEYASCLNQLLSFFTAGENRAARIVLASRSWAASTCHELLDVTCEPIQKNHLRRVA